MSKGVSNKKPKLAGIDEIDVPTAQADVPATYFAGARKLNVTWIMQPVIAFTKPSPAATGKGK
jgi:hypothetical protein